VRPLEETTVGPVDVLTMATSAARMIRNAPDPDAILAEATRRFSVRPAGPGESLASFITRLIEEAGERRTELYQFLARYRGQLYMNRNKEDWGQSGEFVPYEPDPEARELLAYIATDGAKKSRVDLFGDRIMGPFALQERKMVRYVEECKGDLPETTRGLIDYPLKNPVLFTIDLGSNDWELWDVFCAFADQYALIYEQPQRYGVRDHDFSDLWLELLYYYPDRNVIYPFVGS
jgi:hypothetical protein